MKKKLVVLDLDQTIVYSHPVYPPLLEAFSKNIGMTVFDTAKFSAGYLLPLQNDLGWGVSLEQQPELCDQIFSYHVEQMKYHGNFVPKLVDGMNKIIPELAEDYDMAIYTMNARKTAYEFLEQHYLNQYFPNRKTLCCIREHESDIPQHLRLKPHAFGMELLLKQTGHQPEDAAMSGDSPGDILSARNIGSKSIAAMWGTTSRESMMAANPHYIAETPYEWPELFGKALTP